MDMSSRQQSASLLPFVVTKSDSHVATSRRQLVMAPVNSQNENKPNQLGQLASTPARWCGICFTRWRYDVVWWMVRARPYAGTPVAHTSSTFCYWTSWSWLFVVNLFLLTYYSTNCTRVWHAIACFLRICVSSLYFLQSWFSYPSLICMCVRPGYRWSCSYRTYDAPVHCGGADFFITTITSFTTLRSSSGHNYNWT